MSSDGNRLIGVLATLLLLSVAPPGFAAQGADAGSKSQTAQAAQSQLPGITIESAREKAVRREVDHFVSSVVVQPSDDAVDRWNIPVPKSFGEHMG